MAKNLNMVDAMKFVMAFCVIGIHSYIFGPQELPSFLNYIVMTAVSFFITASGYLCFRGKISVSETMCKTLALKFLRLYLMWTLIYLPLIMFDYIKTGESIMNILISFMHKLCITGSNPWAYHLWYLLAVAIACGLIGILAKIRLPLFAIWMIGVALMVLGYYAVKDDGAIGHIVQPILGNANNGFTYGFGAFASGMIITSIKRFKLSIALIAISLGYVLYCNSLPLSVLLGGVGIFIICRDIHFRDAPIYKHLRALSTWIYFLHMYVMFVIMFAVLHGWIPRSRWLGWLLAAIVTLVISEIIYRLSLKFKFINKFVK